MTLERLLTDHHRGHPSEATFSTSTNHSRSQQSGKSLYTNHRSPSLPPLMTMGSGRSQMVICRHMGDLHLSMERG